MASIRDQIPAPLEPADVGEPAFGGGWRMKIDGIWIDYAEYTMRQGGVFPESGAAYLAVRAAMGSDRRFEPR